MFLSFGLGLVLFSSVIFAQCPAGLTEVIVTATTDGRGYDTYWVLKENNVVVASGGNPQVVPGAQQWLSNPGIPGAYADNSTYISSACVQSTSNLDFTIMDDWGDGLVSGGYVIAIGGCDWVEEGPHQFDTESKQFSLPLPQNNIAIEDINFQDRVPGSSCLGGTLRNRGTSVLTSFNLKWKYGSSNVYTRSFTNLNIPCNSTYDFTNDQSLNLNNYGSSLPISLWTELPNNMPDEVPLDNMKTANPVVIEGAVTDDKNVLIEQFTGTWNGWEPDGYFVADTILAKHPDNVYRVMLHYADAMENSDGAEIIAEYGSYFPGAMIDRTLFDGEPELLTQRKDWDRFLEKRLEETAPLCVSLSWSYNPATRQLNANVFVEVLDYMLTGDYRVYLHVLENMVTGTGSGYDQINYYHNLTFSPNHPYYNTPSPIVGFVHQDVHRAMMTPANGDSTLLPPSPVPSVYSRTYSYSIPQSFDPAQMALVAFVAKGGPGLEDREVLNAIKSDASGSSFNSCNRMIPPACMGSIYPAFVSINTNPKDPQLGGSKFPKTENLPAVSGMDDKQEFSVYPIPASEKVYIKSVFDRIQPVTIDLYNSMGRRMATSGEMAAVVGMNTFFLDASQLDEGIYRTVIRTKNNVLHSRTLVVAR